MQGEGERWIYSTNVRYESKCRFITGSTSFTICALTFHEVVFVCWGEISSEWLIKNWYFWVRRCELRAGACVRQWWRMPFADLRYRERRGGCEARDGGDARGAGYRFCMSISECHVLSVRFSFTLTWNGAGYWMPASRARPILARTASII